MATSEDTGICYNPKQFRPDNKPLLSVDQWKKIQMFLATASQLPLTKEKYPDERALPIFTAIHDASLGYQTQILPLAADQGNDLWNFAQTTAASFLAVDRLMNKEGGPDHDRIKGLYDDLIKTATAQEQNAIKIADGTKQFAATLQGLLEPLAKLVAQIDVDLGPVKAKIDVIKADLEKRNKVIQDAQARILGDKKTISDTRYYVWIPIIGAIVAAAEIASNNKDINSQLNAIKDATGAVYADQVALKPLSDKVEHLSQAQTLLGNQTKVLGELIPSVAAVAGVWNAIKAELYDVQENIIKAEALALKDNTCLSEIALTTAINEYEAVENDAHDFMANFWIVPVAKKQSA